MKVAYIGDFVSPFTMERGVQNAFEGHLHDVTPLYYGNLSSFQIDPVDYDLILWTYAPSYVSPGPDLVEAQAELIEHAAVCGVPTVGYCQDRWWGTDRQDEIAAFPFFKVSLLLTSDGGNDDRWKSAGVNHAWLPPAISLLDCVRGTPNPAYECDIAFIELWDSAPPDDAYRQGLRSFLEHRDGRCFSVSGPNAAPVNLSALYASTKIVVGDTHCRSGQTWYWSASVPQAMGRRTCLLHPMVMGLESEYRLDISIITWQDGDWGDLAQKLAFYATHDAAREGVAQRAQKETRDRHSFERRVNQILRLAGLR